MLGGADFGAGFWASPGGATRRAIRDHAHHAMGPVWEANHVWLIFVLVVCWTGYPKAFGSIMSTLAVPLFLAAVGIILRGTAYALRSGTRIRASGGRDDARLGVASILTPIALGAAVGGIASGRVPSATPRATCRGAGSTRPRSLVGRDHGRAAAYLAAVYLTGDAVRLGRAGSPTRSARERSSWPWSRAAWRWAGSSSSATSAAPLRRAHARSRAGGGDHVRRSPASPRWPRLGPPLRAGCQQRGGAVGGGRHRLGPRAAPYLLPGLTIERAAAGPATR